MKKFYPALMLSAVAMTGLNASAEKPNWEHQGSWQLFEQANQFRPANHTRPIVADFTNNDRFDVYYGSGDDYDTEYAKPGVQSYSIPATAEKGYKVGVQALSLWNEKYSPFVWSVEDLSSVGSIAADNTNVKVTVNGDAVVVNADANADVQIVDMLGRTIATGVTNSAINVAAKGVMIANVNGKAVKFVK